jgi:hypothetical protein
LLKIQQVRKNIIKALSAPLSARIIKLFGTTFILATLLGCGIFMEDSTFTYRLRIENKLKTSITATAYCYGPKSDGYPCVIQSGDHKHQLYMARGSKLSEKEIYQWFDKQKITLCNEPIDFSLIRSNSPIIKHDEYYFSIVIDDSTRDAFCLQGNGD